MASHQGTQLSSHPTLVLRSPTERKRCQESPAKALGSPEGLDEGTDPAAPPQARGTPVFTEPCAGGARASISACVRIQSVLI